MKKVLTMIFLGMFVLTMLAASADAAPARMGTTCSVKAFDGQVSSDLAGGGCEVKDSCQKDDKKSSCCEEKKSCSKEKKQSCEKKKSCPKSSKQGCQK